MPVTVEEFLRFVASVGSVQNLPVHPFKKKWAKVKDAIAPHYFGELPKALSKAFPNEDEDVWNYRKDNYEPKTENCIVDAISTLSRLLQDSKFSVRYENADFESYVKEDKKIMGERVTNFFLSQFVAKRVLDPNAVLVVFPVGEGLGNARVPVDFELQFIDSEFIDFIDFELNILMYRKPVRKKYEAILGVQVPQEYVTIVITDDFYGYIGYEINKETNQPVLSEKGTINYTFRNIYQHKLGFLPFVVLGGRPVQKNYLGFDFTYYKSDFSSAVPFLNSVSTSDNQLQSVIFSNAHPYKIMDGVDCPTCHGQGQIRKEPTPEKPDGEIVSCKSCKGSGNVINLSPLKGIVLRKNGEDEKNVMPLQFVSPNVDTMTILDKFAGDRYTAAKEVLNIDKAIKYAQSGVAKELDKEDSYIKVKAISDSIFYKMQVILTSIQGLVFKDISSSVYVIPPSSFDIKNEAELYEEFKKTIESGAPDFVRATAFRAWLKERFSSDEIGQRIADICLMYSPLYLYTIEERNESYLQKSATIEDLIRALFVFNEVMKMYENDHNIIYEDIDRLTVMLDAALQPRFDEAVKVIQLPEIEPGQEL